MSKPMGVRLKIQFGMMAKFMQQARATESCPDDLRMVKQVLARISK